MSVSRTAFFAAVRPLFGGHLQQSQVDGLAVLLEEGETRGLDLRWIAYVLATAYHETAYTMQPIREWGLGTGQPYGRPDPDSGLVYYGRGYVQLTHAVNYRRMGTRLGVDLYHQPDLALDPAIACKIIYTGMIEGLFTGHKLAEYFGATSDWYGARRIINGVDRASQIGSYATRFYVACRSAPDAPAPAIS